MIDQLLERIRPVCSSWRASSTGFPKGAPLRGLGDGLPVDYLALLERIGPGEGFVGRRYLRLYPLDELDAVNAAYDIPRYFPEHQLFGSDAIGNAFLFDLRARPISVVEVPFIPLDAEYVEVVRADFVSFLEALAEVPLGYIGALPYTPNPAIHGLEVHEKQPVALGGSATDPANKTLIAPPEHSQACTFYNRVFHKLRTQPRPL